MKRRIALSCEEMRASLPKNNGFVSGRRVIKFTFGKKMAAWKAAATAAVGAALVFLPSRLLPIGPPPRDRTTLNEPSELTAVVVGASGATGRQLVRELVKAKSFTKVIAVTRREPAAGELYDGDTRPPKLTLQQVVETTPDSEVVAAWRGADVFFNALGTTRAKAGSAAAFQAVEVDLTARMARLARKAGVPCASLVSAQGANEHGWVDPWEKVHPLLYVRTLGRKEASMRVFPHLSVFRPGMLDRLMGDRAWELAVNKLGLGLRVDLLARAMVLDAEAMVLDAGRAAADVNVHHETVHPNVVHAGNRPIEHWAVANNWKGGPPQK